MASRALLVVLALVVLGASAGGAAAAEPTARAPSAAGGVVDAGALRAEINAFPWRLRFLDVRGSIVLSERRGAGVGPTGTLGFRTARGWFHATRVESSRRKGSAYTARLATTDPRGGRLDVRIAPDDSGVLALTATVTPPRDEVTGVGIAFAALRRERYLGFGERSNAVDQRGLAVTNRVEEGPYRPEDYPLVRDTIPPWALREAPDATSYPIPWLLSTAGYGVLVDNDETSRFDLRGATSWRLEVNASRLALRVFAGPAPADALRRMTAATGRQATAAAPWQWGAWFGTGHANQQPREQEFVAMQRDADVPISAAETHMRYMPCGADRGNEASERARVAAFRAAGLATLTYTREAVCREDSGDFDPGASSRAYVRRRDGSPYIFQAFVDGRATEIAELDFDRKAGRDRYRAIVGRAVTNGYDGWMEDYGEYTPPDAVAGLVGQDVGGDALRNLYPVRYHRFARLFAKGQSRPIVRLQRSGWTGATASAQVVSGGEPTTTWGFDGLRSALRNGLTMGLSGVGIWGSDIGGFYTGSGERLSPELLARWIELGAVSGVMRTRAEGVGASLEERPQVWEAPTLPIWRRYTKLRTQLYPYIVAADRVYRRTGMPLMRHLALEWPKDRRATASEDELLFGPDLLAAPILEPGARSRDVYLPAGEWVDFSRGVAYDETTGGLRAGRARVLTGGRTRRVPALLAELPLMVRAGSVLPLLSPDVDTLAGYGDDEKLVKLRDRRDRLTLLAFPRGERAARFLNGDALTSDERSDRWELRLRGRRTRRYDVQATLSTLRAPFRPCAVTLDGRPLRRAAWRYDAGTKVLRATFRTKEGRLAAQKRC